MGKKIILLFSLFGLLSGFGYWAYSTKSTHPSFVGEWMAIIEHETLQLIEFTEDERMMLKTWEEEREATYKAGKQQKNNRALYYHVTIDSKEYYLIYPEADNLNYAYLMESTARTKSNTMHGKVVCELIRP